MSFSSVAKNELSRIIPENRCCQLAELSAIVRMGGIIRFRGFENVSLRMVTENAAIARKVFTLLKRMYDLNVDIMVRKNKHLKKNHSYIMEVTAGMGAKKVLMDTGIMLKDSDGVFRINYSIPPKITEKRCCKRAYLRGAFLGGGSVSDPERTYHLEFVTHSEEHAEGIKELINGFGLNSKIVERKNNYVVYLKEGEQIVDILNIIGAHNALLNFENTRIYKQMRNDVNRIVNCETANLTKTINAAMKQIENIEYIKNTVGLSKLSPGLREIAELRLNYRDSSLKELGEMLSPPLGKSGINHRLRKIEEIANQIRASRGEL
jgi:hypothetical protein